MGSTPRSIPTRAGGSLCRSPVFVARRPPGAVSTACLTTRPRMHELWIKGARLVSANVSALRAPPGHEVSGLQQQRRINPAGRLPDVVAGFNRRTHVARTLHVRAGFG